MHTTNTVNIKHMTRSTPYYDKIIVCIPEVIKSNNIHQNQICFHKANTKTASVTEMDLHILTICALMLK